MPTWLLAVPPAAVVLLLKMGWLPVVPGLFGFTLFAPFPEVKTGLFVVPFRKPDELDVEPGVEPEALDCRLPFRVPDGVGVSPAAGPPPA